MRKLRNNELYGLVMEALGGRRFNILCSDGKTRIVKAKGDRSMPFLREDYIVIIEPWIVQSNIRANIKYVFNKYDRNKLSYIFEGA